MAKKPNKDKATKQTKKATKAPGDYTVPGASDDANEKLTKAMQVASDPTATDEEKAATTKAADDALAGADPGDEQPEGKGVGLEGGDDPVEAEEVPEPPSGTVCIFRLRRFGKFLPQVPTVCRQHGLKFEENFKEDTVTITVPCGASLPPALASYTHEAIAADDDLLKLTIPQLQRIAKKAGLGLIGRERKADLIGAIRRATAE